MTPTERNLKLYTERYRRWLVAHRNNDPIAGGDQPPPKPEDYGLHQPGELHAAMLARKGLEASNG